MKTIDRLTELDKWCETVRNLVAPNVGIIRERLNKQAQEHVRDFDTAHPGFFERGRKR
jgi:hypothetical protein